MTSIKKYPCKLTFYRIASNDKSLESFVGFTKNFRTCYNNHKSSLRHSRGDFHSFNYGRNRTKLNKYMVTHQTNKTFFFIEKLFEKEYSDYESALNDKKILVRKYNAYNLSTGTLGWNK